MCGFCGKLWLLARTYFNCQWAAIHEMMCHDLDSDVTVVFQVQRSTTIGDAGFKKIIAYRKTTRWPPATNMAENIVRSISFVRITKLYGNFCLFIRIPFWPTDARWLWNLVLCRYHLTRACSESTEVCFPGPGLMRLAVPPVGVVNNLLHDIHDGGSSSPTRRA